MKLDRVIKLEREFVQAVINLYDNALRFRWTHEFVLEATRTNIYDKDEYKALPRYAQSHVAGALEVCRKLHERHLVYSYEIDGVRMMITEERYRKVSPERVHKEFSHTGAFVYKEDPTKLWTEPKPKEAGPQRLVLSDS